MDNIQPIKLSSTPSPDDPSRRRLVPPFHSRYREYSNPKLFVVPTEPEKVFEEKEASPAACLKSI